jgi:anti-sigma-K factor RskA
MDAEAHELIAGYALDALDEADRARAKELLATSEEAREELRAFTDVAAAMAMAAVGPAPRSELRDRIVAAARAEPQNVVSLEARRRGRAAPLLGAVAAVAATVAIGLGIYASSLSGELDDTKAVIAQLSDPSARAIGLEGASGRLLVKSDGDAVLVVAGLPKREGKTYAVWVIDSGQKPVPAGLFDDASDATVVPVDGRVGDGAVVAISVEDGPVDAPTTTPVVTSQAV